MWNAYPGRPVNWVHPSVEAAEFRPGKVAHVLEQTRQGRATVREWMEALVTDGTAEASAVAIRILAAMVREGSPFAEEARAARIVLTEESRLVPAVVGKVFRRAVQDGLGTARVRGPRAVGGRVAHQRSQCPRRIREADSRGRFIGVLEQGFTGYNGRTGHGFWELFHNAGGSQVSGEVIARVPEPMATLYVRTVDGRFHRMRDCLLPGAVVPADGSRDRSVAVDLDFHSDDRMIFHEFGLRPAPTVGHRPSSDEAWFAEYSTAIYDSYCRTLSSNAARPSFNRLKVEGAPIGGPLHLLSLCRRRRARPS